MALTPNEIVHKEFDKKLRGYDPDQVNDFLDIVVANFEDLIQENNHLKQELATAQERNAYFAQLQDSLNSSIVVAQEAADRLKQNARKEAELIIYEAEREANAHVDEANEYAQNLLSEAQTIRVEGQAYHRRFEALVREQLERLSGPEYSLFFEEQKVMTDLAKPEIQRTTQEVSGQVEKLIQQTNEQMAQAPGGPFEHHVTPEPHEVNEVHEVHEVHEEPEMHDMYFDPTPAEPEPMPQQNTESVLGETIRIELPKD